MHSSSVLLIFDEQIIFSPLILCYVLLSKGRFNCLQNTHEMYRFTRIRSQREGGAEYVQVAISEVMHVLNLKLQFLQWNNSQSPTNIITVEYQI